MSNIKIHFTTIANTALVYFGFKGFSTGQLEIN